MNNKRRNAIEKNKNEIINVVYGAYSEDSNKICTMLEDYKSKIEDILIEEQDAFDNMPEGLQYSMRGEDSQEAIEQLEEAVDIMDRLIDYFAEGKNVEEELDKMLDELIDMLTIL
jgi:hypothetical protein